MAVGELHAADSERVPAQIDLGARLDVVQLHHLVQTTARHTLIALQFFISFKENRVHSLTEHFHKILMLQDKSSFESKKTLLTSLSSGNL